MEELYLHYPIRLYATVLDQLSTGTTLPFTEHLLYIYERVRLTQILEKWDVRV
jgi:hypothetical protein